MVDGATDVQPLGPARGLGASARSRPRARRATRDGVRRWHERPRPPEGGRCGAKGGAAAERDRREAPVGCAGIPPGDRAKSDGRSRGGYGSKACVIADGTGRAIAFRLAPGQAHELPQTMALLARLPGVPRLGCQRQPPLRGRIGRRPMGRRRSRLHQPCLPDPHLGAWRAATDPASTAWGTGGLPGMDCVNRNRVERLWARLKEWRAVATRYEKTARSFIGVLYLAAAMDWLKS